MYLYKFSLYLCHMGVTSINVRLMMGGLGKIQVTSIVCLNMWAL